MKSIHYTILWKILKKIVSPKEGTTDTFILDDLDAWGNLIYKIEPIA